VTRALIAKEIREHGWVILILWGICALVLFGFMKRANNQGSPFVAFHDLVVSMGPLLSLAIVNRLVVREYGGRTQLFLESLPVTRARVVAVKWCFGACATLLPVAAALAATSALGSARVHLTARFVALLVLRSFGFLLFFYALSFDIGLLGRYRHLAWALLIIGVFVLDTRAQLPLSRWPPFALVADSMAFERQALPSVDLLVTSWSSLLLLAGAFVMALAGEGSISTMLAGRMTRREKVVVGVVAMVPLVLMGLIEARRPKPAYRLDRAIVVEHDALRVGVARSGGLSDAVARAFAEAIASDLVDLKDYLSLSRLPPVYVLPDASLDADVFLRAELPGSDGVVVSGALGSNRFEEEEFRIFVVGEVLSWYTRGRAKMEEQRWFFDGFKQWWMAQRVPRLEERLRRRAAAASTRVASGSDLFRGWLTTREQLGDCLGDAVAWRAVSVLAGDTGSGTIRKVARQMWELRPPEDARVLLSKPFDQVLRETTGLATPDLAAKVALRIAEDRSRLDRSRNPISSWSTSFDAPLLHGRLHEIHYQLRAGEAEIPPYSVRYSTLQPWTGELDTPELHRVDAVRDGVLPLTVEGGARVFAGIDARDDDLECTVRIGARRWIIP
jgi:hypothetical protein